jgi:mannosyltransferase
LAHRLPSFRLLPSPSTTLLTLAIVTALGAALRLVQLGAKPLWLDEAFSLWVANLPVPILLRQVASLDQHPPLYYLLLRLWMRFGQSDSWARTLSACASVLNIPVLYLLGRHLEQRETGLLAALILALSPFHILYAQEARMYALFSLSACLALWALACLLTDPRAGQAPVGHQFLSFLRAWWVDRRCPSLQLLATDLAWVGYVVFTATALLTHNAALLLPFTATVCVLTLNLWRRHRPDSLVGLEPPSLRNWAAAQAAVFVLWIPWLRAFVGQTVRVARAFWIQPPTPWTVVQGFLRLLNAYFPPRVGWVVLIAVLSATLLALGTHSLRARPARMALLHTLWVLPFAVQLLVSLRRPIFAERTLIWTSIPLYLLLALGLRQLRRRPLMLAAIALVVASYLASVRWYVLYAEKEPWDAVAALVAREAQEGDLILFHASWVQIPFDHYLRDLHPSVEERGVPVDLFERGELEPKMAFSDLPRLRALVSGRTRVWLVYSHNWYTDPDGLVLSTIQQTHALQQHYEFHQVQVYLFVSR